MTKSLADNSSFGNARTGCDENEFFASVGKGPLKNESERTGGLKGVVSSRHGCETRDRETKSHKDVVSIIPIQNLAFHVRYLSRQCRPDI